MGPWGNPQGTAASISWLECGVRRAATRSALKYGAKGGKDRKNEEELYTKSWTFPWREEKKKKHDNSNFRCKW